MNRVDEIHRPASAAEQAMLRQQARENLRRTIDIWLARTAAGGSPAPRSAKMLRSKSLDIAEPIELA